MCKVWLDTLTKYLTHHLLKITISFSSNPIFDPTATTENDSSGPERSPFPLITPLPPRTLDPRTLNFMADAQLRHAPAADLGLTPAAAAHDGLHFWQVMLSGSLAGIVEHTAMFPVDTLKTRMQASASHCHLRTLLASSTAPNLYRGVAAMTLGAGPAHAVHFSVYELSKSFLSRHASPDNPLAHACSGVLATVASDAVINPMDTVKQRLQLHTSPYSGVADCVRRVLKEEGVRAFYASYRTTVVMNAPFTAVYFATYEAAKRALSEVSPDSVSDERVVVHATAGAAAGALAAGLTTPLDVVKTQLQCQGVCGCDRFSSSSTGGVLRAIIKRDGYSGLMRGWLPRMLFHAPAAAICWSTYEASKSFFQRLNDEKATPWNSIGNPDLTVTEEM